MFELSSRIDLGNDESPTEEGGIGLENSWIRRIVMSEGWSRDKLLFEDFEGELLSVAPDESLILLGE